MHEAPSAPLRALRPEQGESRAEGRVGLGVWGPAAVGVGRRGPAVPGLPDGGAGGP